jgi:membrane protease YdiL (CAAX protease family)
VTYFKSVFGDRLTFSPLLGTFLIFLIGVPRFIVVLQANVTGNYRFTSIIFMIMWVLPFLLLTKKGRRLIGIVKTNKKRALVYSFAIGTILCIPVFLLGYLLYGYSDTNWFVYISNSYSSRLPGNLTEQRFMYFAIFALISMIFSPIGEELMYRGFIHQCFEPQYGRKGASRIDSAAFALTHLAHYGIVFTAAGWVFKPLPAFLWVIAMFAVSRFFFYCRVQSGSIWGAILAHAGFNLAMTFIIFYFVL